MMRMVDFSSFNPGISNWEEYLIWSKNGGQTSGIIIRVCEGTAFVDSTFSERAKEALANGVDEIWYYSYAHPEFNSPQAEVEYLWQAVKNVVRQDADSLMLDMEQTVKEAIPQWSLAWLNNASFLVRKLPVFYSYLAYIEERGYSSFPIIAKYPLGLAAYSFSMPGVPSPWTKALWWQNSDDAYVPGISAPVDTDIQESSEQPIMSENDYKNQQAHDIWSSTLYDATTGIHTVWLEKYQEGIVCGMPVSHEIKTVDWEGVGIVCQYFASGIRIEWYADGTNHGYTYNAKLW